MTLDDGEISDVWLDQLVKLADSGEPGKLVEVARVVIPALVREVRGLRRLVDKLRKLERAPRPGCLHSRVTTWDGVDYCDACGYFVPRKG